MMCDRARYMLLTEAEANARLSSPTNLINRLRSITKVSDPNPVPQIKVTAEQLIPDLDEKIKAPLIKKKAAAIANKALDKLDEVIDNVEKPSQLSRIATEMDKIVNSDSENGRSNIVPQVIVYAPQIVREEIFDTITVSE